MNSKSILLMFIIFLSIFSVGFAVLGTNINIEGTTSIKSSKWNVYLDNIKVNKNSVSSSIPVINNLSNYSITYDFTFTKPGDYYEFTVDVINDGSIDAMIDSIDNKVYIVEDNVSRLIELPNYLKYTITYSDNTEVIKNQVLKSNDIKTYKIKVEYLKDINNNELPVKDINLKFKSNIYYVQA